MIEDLRELEEMMKEILLTLARGTSPGRSRAVESYLFQAKRQTSTALELLNKIKKDSQRIPHWVTKKN